MGTSLSGKKIKDSYDGLIKTTDNAAVGATDKELTDGLGNDLNISVNTSGDITADGTVEAASIVKTSGTSDQILLADGTTIDITQESETIGSNDNDTSIPTSAAVKDYVDDEISDLIGGAPSTLDTLNEIAAALDDNDSFSDTVVLKAGSTMTGNLESTGFVKTGGTSSEFLKADGSVDSNTYLTSATDTTYTISAVDGDNADEEKIRITGSDSTTDDVVLEAGTGLTIARSGDKITFTNSSTGTTYSTSVVDSGDDAIIRLTGSDSTTDDITLEAGSNITLTPSGDTLTIDSAITEAEVISANTNAEAFHTYVLTADLTLTLPSSPSTGDVIKVSNRSGVDTPIVARNGNKIMGAAEDLTIDRLNSGFEMIYSGSAQGWVLIGVEGTSA